MNEEAIKNRVRLEAANIGIRLWRNNVGAMRTDDGRFIRFGLANDSKAVNELIKSGDLIGIKPIIITAEMVGKTIGQFISREVKRGNWRFMGTAREQAQLRWIELINSLGGDACFVNTEGTFSNDKR